MDRIPLLSLQEGNWNWVDTVRLVKAPIGRRQHLDIDSHSLAIRAPGVLRDTLILTSEDVDSIVALDRVSEVGLDQIFAREINIVFLTPNPHAEQNLVIALKRQTRLPYRRSWAWNMVPRAIRKRGADFIELAVDDLDAAIATLHAHRWAVTGDLVGAAARTAGVEHDPDVIALAQSREHRAQRVAAWRQGGGILMLGDLVLLREWLEGYVQGIEAAIGALAGLGSFVLVMSLTSRAPADPDESIQPTAPGPGQRRANRSVITTFLITLLAGGVSWGLVFLGAPVHWVVGVGSGVIGGGLAGARTSTSP